MNTFSASGINLILNMNYGIKCVETWFNIYLSNEFLTRIARYFHLENFQYQTILCLHVPHLFQVYYGQDALLPG